MTPSPQRQVVLFVILTFALSALFDYPIFRPQPLADLGGIYLAAVMWCPGIAAIIVLLLSRSKIASLGLKIGNPPYYLLALLLPIAYSLLPYSIVWLSGLGAVDHTFSPDLASLLLIAFPTACLRTLGEEIGWRGLLVPKLRTFCGIGTVYVVSGIIWAAWHYPAIFIGDYYSGDHALYATVCFTVGIMGIAVVSAWLRLMSGSIWPVMVLHATHNVFVQRVLDPLTLDTGSTEMIVGEFGAVYVVIGILVGVIFWRMSSRLPEPLPRSGSVAGQRRITIQ